MIVVNIQGHEENQVDGDMKCKACSWPTPERCECGGVIHFYNYDEYWIPETNDEYEAWDCKCDKCGKEGM